MGNTETFLRDPPAQSRFGPWFHQTDENGLGDIPFIGILSFFVSFAILQLILSFGVFSQVANIRNKKERSDFLKRTCIQYAAMFFMIFLGWAILGASFAYTWKEDSVEASVPYRAGSSEHIHARVGIHVGLRGINVTLVGLPKRQNCQLIKWNEQYLWSEGQNEVGGWLQGRFGFGPYSNLLAQQFRDGQARGTPIPILEVLEWLTIDGEFIRWYRWFREGGYYCHIFLWIAFTFWVLTIVVTFINPATGSLWLALTGCSMWFAAALYHGLTEKGHPTLRIPFEGHFLEPKFGWAYHLTLVLGILVNLLGLALWAGFTYFGFRTDAFVLSFTEHKAQRTPTQDAVSDYEAKQMELKDVSTEKTAAGEEQVAQESVYGADSFQHGFQRHAPAPAPTAFGRSYSVMNSGTSRRARPSWDASPLPGAIASSGGTVRFAPLPPRPRRSQPERGSFGAPQSLRARSSRRTKKHFGRPSQGVHSTVRAPPTRSKDTFDDLAGVLDNLQGGGSSGLATVSETPEEVPEARTSSNSSGSSGNDDSSTGRNGAAAKTGTSTSETSI